jgi:hypothetical protein
MHLGAYYDPGMEFGNFFDNIQYYNKAQCEEEFDKPFSGKGVRIVKSHVFAHCIPFLKKHWPECPIILVHRDNDKCLGWWVRCGHFNITYPKYDIYYKNLREMGFIINRQNKDILDAAETYETKSVEDNKQLCEALNIQLPPTTYYQNYENSDVKVRVL